ncbi:MAG: FG-GAP-like repeat-containing protein [bacterium]
MKTPPIRLASTLAGLALAAPSPAGAQFLESVTTIHTWEGTVPGDGWGICRTLGDLDGDGVPDYGIGVPAADFTGDESGRAWIFSGATGDTIRTHAKGAGANFGYDLAAVGDVDDDGVSDYVITAPRTRNFFTFNPPGVGRAFLFSGATGEQLHSWFGTDYDSANGRGFGSLCSGAGGTHQDYVGDVNADGVPDIIIGACIGGTDQRGRLYVFSGADPATALYTVSGETVGGLLGFGGGGVGDLDGDGFDDFCAGAPDEGPGNRGRVYVYSGQTGTQFPFSPLEPDTNGGRFGMFFANSPGDLNADGVPDLVVGDFLDAELGASTGKLYTFSGADGSLLYKIAGEAAGDGFGVVRGAGDANLDGTPDLLVAAFSSSAAAPSAGKAYVLSGVDGSVLRTITCTLDGDVFGIAIFGSPDANGDGVPDFLLGATGNDAAGDNAGRVYLIAGEPSAVGLPAMEAPSNDLLTIDSRPNPSRGASEVRFTIPRRAEVSVTIHDAAGRTVRVIESRAADAGDHSVIWDGRDRRGRLVGSGVYWATVRALGTSASTKLVRAR